MKGLVTRRGWLRLLGASTLGSLLGGVTSPAAARGRCPTFPGDPDDVFPNQSDSPLRILEKLMLGNARYVNDDPILHLRSRDQSDEITSGQAPAAMILSCADSRAVPEYIFDQPRAKLFVCRVAGNIATDELIGSLEYGVKVLQVRLLIVLGHSNCGAVTSTFSLVRGMAFPPAEWGKVQTILEKIRPAVERAIAKSPPDTPELALRQAATEENARLNAALLANLEPILAPGVRSDSLGVVAASYDIDTGGVTIL